MLKIMKYEPKHHWIINADFNTQKLSLSSMPESPFGISSSSYNSKHVHFLSGHKKCRKLICLKCSGKYHVQWRFLKFY